MSKYNWAKKLFALVTLTGSRVKSLMSAAVHDTASEHNAEYGETTSENQENWMLVMDRESNHPVLILKEDYEKNPDKWKMV